MEVNATANKKKVKTKEPKVKIVYLLCEFALWLILYLKLFMNYDVVNKQSF